MTEEVEELEYPLWMRWLANLLAVLLVISIFSIASCIDSMLGLGESAPIEQSGESIAKGMVETLLRRGGYNEAGYYFSTVEHLQRGIYTVEQIAYLNNTKVASYQVIPSSGSVCSTSYIGTSAMSGGCSTVSP